MALRKQWSLLTDRLVRVVIHKVYVTIRVVRSSVSYGRKATRCAKEHLVLTVLSVLDSNVRVRCPRGAQKWTVSFLGSLALPGTKHATDEWLA
jgi:hypothetical protein